MFRILVINPGSTSTKIALFEEDKPVFEHTIAHSADDLLQYSLVMDQFEWRLGLVRETLSEHGIITVSLSAVVGRGGRLSPVRGGTISINEAMLECARASNLGQHASNLGCLLAAAIAWPNDLPAFVVDPVSVDEMWEIAKITGLPEVKRISLSHALNMKAVARKSAAELGIQYEDGNFLVAHLGGGGSVSAHQRGLMVDLFNSDVEGPFSIERAGAVPSWNLIKMCFEEGASEENVWNRVSGNGGLYAHLGTKDGKEVESRIRNGDRKAKLVYQALAYGVSKAIGAMGAALAGKVDAIVLSGGLAYSSMLTNWISDRVKYLAPIFIYPGGAEMEALALGALRVLDGSEEPLGFPQTESYSH